jgi:serine/threonine-protein kinase
VVDVARLGPYELIDRFAVGGVAEIYRAKDTRSGEIVVIKRMRSDKPFDPEMHAGFLREMQVALKAKHKNLIKGYELSSFNNTDYGVMEYVDGQDLESILERARRQRIQVPYGFATIIISEILDGLDFAHRITDPRGELLGLVHRDLAPKNIFVRYDGQVRVGDFGLSLAARQEIVEEVVGTPGYLSPEQARGEQLDARSDIYAVGCMLYELVVGQRAFDVAGKSDNDMLRMHAMGKHRQVTRDVPEQLVAVLETALARDREERYPTAVEMRRALRRTEHPPDDVHTPLGIATLVRRLFEEEFKKSRLPGNPLPFLSS